MAPQTKSYRNKQTAEGCQTNAVDLPQDNVPDHLLANMEKPTVPTTTQQVTIWKSQKGTGDRDRNSRKILEPMIGKGHDIHRKQNKATIRIYRQSKQKTPT